MRYYTAAQARKALGGINANKLKHYVDIGIINRYTPPDRKQGLYLKAEVDALAEEIRKFYEGGDKDDSEELYHQRTSFDSTRSSATVTC